MNYLLIFNLRVLPRQSFAGNARPRMVSSHRILDEGFIVGFIVGIAMVFFIFLIASVTTPSSYRWGGANDGCVI